MRGSDRAKGFSRLNGVSRFALPSLIVALLGASELGCGGSAATGSMPPPSDGSTAASSGLVDGAHLTAPFVIPAGTTVTIPAGAKIVADPMVTITVQGVLVVQSAAGPHAQIVATTPADAAHAWGGLIVDTGGDLEAAGLDLAGAATALEVRTGAVAAHYDSGTISAPQNPFRIDAGGRLDTSHAAVVGAMQPSSILGQLHASYLDYEKAAFNEGLITMSASAVLDAVDSTFHGTVAGTGDFIVSDAAALIHVAYSTITDCHCAFHFDDVTQFEIDHVTAGAASPSVAGGLNAWGAMLYGSGAGPNTISNSNFMDTDANLDQEGTNGPLTITNTYTNGGINTPVPTWTWLPADVAAAPVADAKPR